MGSDEFGLIAGIVMIIALAYLLMDKYGKSIDQNTPAGQAAPFTMLNPNYNPYIVTPARSEYVPGGVGDWQFWLTQVTTDTGLRW